MATNALPMAVPDVRRGAPGPSTPAVRVCGTALAVALSSLVAAGVRRCDEWQRIGFYGMSWGWIPGRKQDLSDFQYRMWRSFFPLLVPGLLLHVLAGRLLFKRYGVRARVRYAVVTAGAALVCLHGAASVWLLLILGANYSLSRILGGRGALPACAWALNGALLFACDYYDGFPFAAISPSLAWLDGWRGLLRWHVHFNLCFLRLISFVLDHHWALRAAHEGRSRADAQESQPANDGYELRVATHLPLAHYSAVHFFAYAFYLPLYIAGPIVPFNGFVSQLYAPQRSFGDAHCGAHLVRVGVYMLGLEVALHYLYYYGLNESRAWASGAMRPWEVALTGFFTLNFMYVKFLSIWRFFRVWALLDGVEAPENMRRCVNNNYTFAGFWRAWHASLNKWIVRYMYVPLGGTRTQAWSVWIIFTFVGLWHDLWWRWVAWAWLNCAFFNAEMVVTSFYRSARFDALRQGPWAPHVAAAAGALDILFLMIANLAILHGFGGTYEFLWRAFAADGGPVTLAASLAVFYSAVIVMQSIRAREWAAAGTVPRC